MADTQRDRLEALLLQAKSGALRLYVLRLFDGMQVDIEMEALRLKLSMVEAKIERLECRNTHLVGQLVQPSSFLSSHAAIQVADAKRMEVETNINDLRRLDCERKIAYAEFEARICGEPSPTFAGEGGERHARACEEERQCPGCSVPYTSSGQEEP